MGLRGRATRSSSGVAQSWGTSVKPGSRDWADEEQVQRCREMSRGIYQCSLCGQAMPHECKGEIGEAMNITKMSLSDLQRRYRMNTSNAMQLQDDLRALNVNELQRANVSAATRSDSVVAEGVTAGETACSECDGRGYVSMGEGCMSIPCPECRF
jgi:hypothetical protein